MKKFFFTLLLIYILNTFLLVFYLFTVPDCITCYKSEKYISIQTPIFIELKLNETGILQKTTTNILYRTSTFYINKKQNNFICTLKIANIPLKTLKISIIEKKNLMVLGKFIGIKLMTDGVLVIGYSAVYQNDNNSVTPAKDAGVQIGDKIIMVNNTKIKDCNQLYDLIKFSKGKNMTFTIKRGVQYKKIKIRPILSAEGTYKIGLWVRDGTSGIGTLTYIDPQTYLFGALGHGISDIDTNILLDVKEGEIYKANIIDIRKNQEKEIGEIVGKIDEDNVIGKIIVNTPYGIFGKITNKSCINLYNLYEVGRVQDIHVGDAFLICNVNNRSERFKIKVVKLLPIYRNSTKAFVIKVVDRKLVEKTGGIVQGMSGAPIIQDNKLIGAVTHVFIKDPDMGYGVFIENMINITNKIH